jgi:poly(hydroxyalkanoate) depolymerase family esterase
MHHQPSHPWVAPALKPGLRASYIYPGSYPKTLKLERQFKAQASSGSPDPARQGYHLRGYTREPLGRLAGAPFIRPSRTFLLYVPRGYRPEESRPLVVWLHGCRQSAEEFRNGTRITEWADRRGLLVLMPRQSKWANALGCWNWFDPATQNGTGETALVIAQTQFICSRWRVDPDRVWIAGMSSGAALAACIAVHAHTKFRAAAFVAGLADGAASSAATAAKVMRGATDVDVTNIAHRVEHRTDARIFRSLIIHGDLDEVAAPSHANELARQMLALNGESPVSSPLRQPDAFDENQVGGRKLRRAQFNINAQACVDLVRIQGLAHAWSGGDAHYPFNDASPPDATQMILDFFADQSADQ